MPKLGPSRKLTQGLHPNGTINNACTASNQDALMVKKDLIKEHCSYSEIEEKVTS